jgi:SAM-dependent methyltransferase
MPETSGKGPALRQRLADWRQRTRARTWVRNGRVPGTSGYSSARWLAIDRALASAPGDQYGRDDAGLDERVVEYPWALHRLAARHRAGDPILDAGSVLNHRRILAHCRRTGLQPISIVTLKYEGFARVSDEVRYEFADLRRLPYRDEWFGAVVCLSTLEHVGMDNSMYGDSAGSTVDPSRETEAAMREIRRVTRPGGALLLSVPFGAREDRGWLRLFDAAELQRLTAVAGWRVDDTRVVRATRDGWRACAVADAATAGYNEPRSTRRSSVRTAPEWVSAAEAVALVELTAV